MVFSVQQGADGPLVVYKLKVPEAARAATPAGTFGRIVRPLPEAASPRLSPLRPTILGTVVMPAPQRASTSPAPPSSTAVPDQGPSETFTFGRLYEEVDDLTVDDTGMTNWSTGETVTLQEVNDAVAWRRDTAERLRQLPVGPRF